MACSTKRSSSSPPSSAAPPARKAATATGAVLAGVDLITDANGHRMVLEINAVPGWRALARVNSIDVADRLITWIEAHAGGAARATG